MRGRARDGSSNASSGTRAPRRARYASGVRKGDPAMSIQSAVNAPHAPPSFDADACWRAVRARDRSQDGRFVTGVLSTGIYCRPSCPARHPRRSNGTPATANATTARRRGGKGSFSHHTAISMANTALVSRKAAAAATGACMKTQRINR